MKNPEFDLEEFSKINLERCNDPEVYNCKDKPATYFACGLMEEAGEVGGILKKLERGFNSREKLKIKSKLLATHQLLNPGENPEYIDKLTDEDYKTLWVRSKVGALSEELADLFTMMDLICTKYNISLFPAVKDKFNKVSQEMGYPKYNIQNHDG